MPVLVVLVGLRLWEISYLFWAVVVVLEEHMKLPLSTWRAAVVLQENLLQMQDLVQRVKVTTDLKDIPFSNPNSDSASKKFGWTHRIRDIVLPAIGVTTL